MAESVQQLRAYAAIYWLALRSSRQRRGEIVGRLVFLGILLSIFSRLWEITLGTGGDHELNSQQMIWYLALTEWIVLSIYPVQIEMEHEIQSGQVYYRLARPLSYSVSKIAEALGHSSSNFLVLGCGAIGYATLLSGGYMLPLGQLLRGLPLLWGGVVLGLLFQSMIGMLAFWFLDINPLSWIWQKALFIGGGLLLPLSFYPDLLQSIAIFSPFPAILYLPAMATVQGEGHWFGEAWRLLAIWTLFIICLLRWLTPKLLRAYERIGG